MHVRGGVFWGAAKFQVDVKAGEGGRGSPGYYIRRKRNWKQRLYKMLKGEQTRCIFEICENGSILRTAVADKEKFDDEFCSEFKYDIF